MIQIDLILLLLTIIPSPSLKKILKIGILEGSKLTQFYHFLTIIPSPWLKKFLKFGFKKSLQIYSIPILFRHPKFRNDKKNILQGKEKNSMRIPGFPGFPGASPKFHENSRFSRFSRVLRTLIFMRC